MAPEGKRLLQAAAVIVKDVALPLLLAISDVPEYEVRAELTRLQGSENSRFPSKTDALIA